MSFGIGSGYDVIYGMAGGTEGIQDKLQSEPSMSRLGCEQDISRIQLMNLR